MADPKFPRWRVDGNGVFTLTETDTETDKMVLCIGIGLVKIDENKNAFQ